MLTAEQVMDVCGRISAGTENLQWTGLLGYCSRKALEQPTAGKTCAESADACYRGDQQVIPPCTSVLPDCPPITLDQFVACRIATIGEFLSFNNAFSCSSMPPFEKRAVPQACVEPYRLCPNMAALDPG
jgi:hypothetical protein